MSKLIMIIGLLITTSCSSGAEYTHVVKSNVTGIINVKLCYFKDGVIHYRTFNGDDVRAVYQNVECIMSRVKVSDE